MIVKDIECVNFRNICKARLEFSASFNVIEGMNAQGKTNLLEALHIFSLGRGFRTRITDELVRFGEEYFFLRINGKSDRGVEFAIDFGYEKGRRAKVSVNRNRLASISEMIGMIPTVIFTPGDVELASGPPAPRRMFIDYTAAQISPAFLSGLREFRKILKQRNSLLRRISAGERGTGELGAWDKAFISKGAALAGERMEVLGETEEIAREIYGKIGPAGERLGIRYRSSFFESRDTIEEDFREAVRRNSPAEIRRGYSLTGPQYDDLEVSLGDASVRRFGSQGRKRLVAIVMKLSQAEVIMRRRTEKPVVLLDDIFSELDAEVSEKVRELISDRYQSFITSPQKDSFSRLPSGSAVFFVENGRFSARN